LFVSCSINPVILRIFIPSLAPVNPEWFTFLVPAYPGGPGKRPLNGCSSSSSRKQYKSSEACCIAGLAKKTSKSAPGRRLSTHAYIVNN